MSNTGYDVYNLRNIVNVAGAFSFCEGASLTQAQALASGWRDVGSVLATDITPSMETASHKACRLGRLIEDKKYVTSSALEFGLKCEEFSDYLLALALMGSGAGALSQAALPADTVVDTFGFTGASPSGDSRTWYNITQNGVPLRELTACHLVVPVRACAADATTDKITLADHGFMAGTPVVFAGGAMPGGLSAGAVYYVIQPTANDFRVSLADEGNAVDLQSDGSSVTCQQVLTHMTTGAEIGATIDNKTGRVRFLYPVSQTVTVTVQCPAIDTANRPESLLRGINPLQIPNRVGYCRLLFYADDAQNKLVGDYVFKGQITPQGGRGWDGGKSAQFDFTVTVLDDPGTFYVAP